MTDANSARTKVYTHGERPDVRVPFTQVHLNDSPGPTGPQPNAPFRLYDTSGPGGVPEQGTGSLQRRAAGVQPVDRVADPVPQPVSQRFGQQRRDVAQIDRRLQSAVTRGATAHEPGNG